MKVNVQKTKVVIFNAAGKILKSPALTIGGECIETVQNFCYLGINVSCKGSFINAKQTHKEKGFKARFPLLTTLREFDLAPDQALTLFETLITPIYRTVQKYGQLALSAKLK